MDKSDVRRLRGRSSDSRIRLVGRKVTRQSLLHCISEANSQKKMISAAVRIAYTTYPIMNNFHWPQNPKQPPSDFPNNPAVSGANLNHLTLRRLCLFRKPSKTLRTLGKTLRRPLEIQEKSCQNPRKTLRRPLEIQEKSCQNPRKTLRRPLEIQEKSCQNPRKTLRKPLQTLCYPWGPLVRHEPFAASTPRASKLLPGFPWVGAPGRWFLFFFGTNKQDNQGPERNAFWLVLCNKNPSKAFL